MQLVDRSLMSGSLEGQPVQLPLKAAGQSCSPLAQPMLLGVTAQLQGARERHCCAREVHGTTLELGIGCVFCTPLFFMLDTCICLVGGREHLLGMCCVSNWLICVVCTYIQWTCIIRFSFPPFTIVDDSWRDNGGKRVQCISMQIVSVCVCVCVCACTHSGCVFCSWHCYQYSFYQWHCYYWKHCPLEVRVEEEEELAIPHRQFTHQPS